ncbi:hypothetical protein PCH_Pc22g13050 [Penicillium rubens Wisconsin 54-1255]|uniref:Uncharacterized protein n=1 Tax=Penicillium rubens (strain ATCC 28089 / DSM 1075 / NRRL 1951 / Wisconsin 54-1255) TaxID=500485 RepID=B6HSR9_PENRW|nr:hypothetical protein PCH_Pc22g13050 [Penicillium rubens Wisconsin 54-1255]
MFFISGKTVSIAVINARSLLVRIVIPTSYESSFLSRIKAKPRWNVDLVVAKPTISSKGRPYRYYPSEVLLITLKGAYGRLGKAYALARSSYRLMLVRVYGYRSGSRLLDAKGLS